MNESTPHTSTGEILSKASILVALPQLQDTFFAKSVILLIEHNSSGAFGFVINRPTEVALKELIYLEEKINLTENARVWFGGPVSTNSGIILEYRPDLLSMDALPFNITTKKESLIKMVTKQDVDPEPAKSTQDNEAQDATREIKESAQPPQESAKISATVADQVLNYIKNDAQSETEIISSVGENSWRLETTISNQLPKSSATQTSEGKIATPRRRVLFPYRFIMGYSGWNQDQLEEELILGNWIQLPFDEELVFNTPVDDLWEQCFTNLGTSPEAIAPTIQPYMN